ncbi:MAG: hypothetical protein O2960_24810 [Verrucomicrobia bacterium]|nr:hypothetical protein [Verrucomicrobiota bacterium]
MYPSRGKMNVVSFSLWGNLPMYCQGAIRNAELMPKVYPGWKMVVYADDSVPREVTAKLFKLGVELRKPPFSNGMFWRFFAATGKDFERVIFRDTDSRINDREARAVREWVESEKRFHVIADHPHHTPVIGGGLWGTRGHVELEKDDSMLLKNDRNVTYNSDQIWLRDTMWPVVKSDVLIHDFCYHSRRPGSKPLPAKFGDWRFVGEVFDETDKPRSFDWEMRMNWMTV